MKKQQKVSSWRQISLQVILYAVLSIVLFVNVSRRHSHRDHDSLSYEKIAHSFYNTNSLVPPEQTSPPLVQQPIGYPLFMGIIYKLFGTSNRYVIWIQIFLMILSGLLLAFAATRLFGPSTGIITHLLFSLNVGYLVFPQFILAETLLVFFLMLFFERFVCFLDTKKMLPLGTSGCALGISTVVKPAAMYYIYPLILVLILGFIFKTFQLKMLAKAILCLAITFFIPIKSYQFYNYQQYGISNFGMLGKFNLYVWSWSKVITEDKKTFYREQNKRIAMITGNPLKSESWQKLENAFWNAFKASPFSFIKTWIREMAKTLLGLYATNLKVLIEPETSGGDISFFNTPGSLIKKLYFYITGGTSRISIKLVALLEFVWNILKYFFVLVALLSLLLKRRLLLLSFFSSYIFYFTLVTIFDGCARYRTMFDFVFLILAGLAITLLFQAVPHSLRQRGDPSRRSPSLTLR